jgi:hypothetical protein
MFHKGSHQAAMVKLKEREIGQKAKKEIRCENPSKKNILTGPRHDRSKQGKNLVLFFFFFFR